VYFFICRQLEIPTKNELDLEGRSPYENVDDQRRCSTYGIRRVAAHDHVFCQFGLHKSSGVVRM